MKIELINTGSELMLGFVLNTHQQWICRALSDLGYEVSRQVAVADTGHSIQDAVGEALKRSDLIITTGGLGPTSDDKTRDLIAELLGRKLYEDAATLEEIKRFFAIRKRSMPAGTQVQALVPERARILPNAHGTAPGLAMEVSPNPFRRDSTPSWVIMLPGPPRELRPMFRHQVVPMLREQFPLESPPVCRTLKSTGLGESIVEEKIAPQLKPLLDAGLEIGYCARIGEVDVRLIARGSGAAEIVSQGTEIIRKQVGQYIYGENDDELESVIVRMLTERKQTLALAESCTGGFLAHRVTNVPGASEIFLSGLVTYSNQAKQSLLGVAEQTLAEHGAVSDAVAREMAEGARHRFGTDFALAVTGIAGPGGGTAEKPVGTVFIALSSAGHTFVLNPLNQYDRETFKYVTTQQALELLRRTLLSR